jgi:8-amino-7-oxononanoate synthase
VLVGGFSKAYSSLLAFLTVPPHWKNLLKVAAPPYLYSGPSPTASLATVLAGMRVNDDRGDAIRARLYRLTARVLEHIRSLGAYTPNTLGTPVIELPLAQGRDLAVVERFLWDKGIYVTLAPYPMVPREQVGFRIQTSAVHTDQQVDELNAVLTQLWERGDLQRASAGR